MKTAKQIGFGRTQRNIKKSHMIPTYIWAFGPASATKSLAVGAAAEKPGIVAVNPQMKNVRV